MDFLTNAARDDAALRDELLRVIATGGNPEAFITQVVGLPEAEARDRRMEGRCKALERATERYAQRAKSHEQRGEHYRTRVLADPETMRRIFSLGLISTQVAAGLIVWVALFMLLGSGGKGGEFTHTGVTAAFLCAGIALTGLFPVVDRGKVARLFSFAVPVLGSALLGIVLWSTDMPRPMVVGLALLAAFVLPRAGRVLYDVFPHLGVRVAWAYHSVMQAVYETAHGRWEMAAARARDALAVLREDIRLARERREALLRREALMVQSFFRRIGGFPPGPDAPGDDS